VAKHKNYTNRLIADRMSLLLHYGDMLLVRMLRSVW